MTATARDKPRSPSEAPTNDGVQSLSAVIVNYNGGNRVLRTIQCLTESSTELEAVLVIDNGSRDGSGEALKGRFPEIDVHELHRNIGLPAARQFGLERVHSDRVVFVDADVYVDPDCVERLCRAMSDSDAAVACPQVRLFPDGATVQTDGTSAHFVGTMLLESAGIPVGEAATGRRFVGGCIGACMLVDRARALAAGGFDARYFFQFEDLEFTLRLRALGHRIISEPSAVVYHDRDSGWPELSWRQPGRYPARRAFYTLRNRWLTILLHYRGRTLAVLAPALLVHEVSVLAYAVRRRWLKAWVSGWAWHFRHLTETRNRRRWIQERRQVPDRDLLVGGPIPIADGVVTTPFAKVGAGTLSRALNAYWRLSNRLIG